MNTYLRYAKTKRKNADQFPKESCANASQTVKCDLNSTLSDSIFLDSFDKLKSDRGPLREQCSFKRNVRASFNRDSSIEYSPVALPKHKSKQIYRRITSSTPQRTKYNVSHRKFNVLSAQDASINRLNESENYSSDLFSLLEDSFNGLLTKTHTTNGIRGDNQISVYTISSAGESVHDVSASASKRLKVDVTGNHINPQTTLDISEPASELISNKNTNRTEQKSYRVTQRRKIPTRTTVTRNDEEVSLFLSNQQNSNSNRLKQKPKWNNWKEENEFEIEIPLCEYSYAKNENRSPAVAAHMSSHTINSTLEASCHQLSKSSFNTSSRNRRSGKRGSDTKNSVQYNLSDLDVTNGSALGQSSEQNLNGITPISQNYSADISSVSSNISLTSLSSGKISSEVAGSNLADSGSFVNTYEIEETNHLRNDNTTHGASLPSRKTRARRIYEKNNSRILRSNQSSLISNIVDGSHSITDSATRSSINDTESANGNTLPFNDFEDTSQFLVKTSESINDIYTSCMNENVTHTEFGLLVTNEQSLNCSYENNSPRDLRHAERKFKSNAASTSKSPGVSSVFQSDYSSESHIFASLLQPSCNTSESQDNRAILKNGNKTAAERSMTLKKNRKGRNNKSNRLRIQRNTQRKLRSNTTNESNSSADISLASQTSVEKLVKKSESASDSSSQSYSFASSSQTSYHTNELQDSSANGNIVNIKDGETVATAKSNKARKNITAFHLSRSNRRNLRSHCTNESEGSTNNEKPVNENSSDFHGFSNISQFTETSSIERSKHYNITRRVLRSTKANVSNLSENSIDRLVNAAELPNDSSKCQNFANMSRSADNTSESIHARTNSAQGVSRSSGRKTNSSASSLRCKSSNNDSTTQHELTDSLTSSNKTQNELLVWNGITNIESEIIPHQNVSHCYGRTEKILDAKNLNSITSSKKSVTFLSAPEEQPIDKIDLKSINVTKRKQNNNSKGTTICAELPTILESSSGDNTKLSEHSNQTVAENDYQQYVPVEIRLPSGKWRRTLAAHRRNTFLARSAYLLEQTDVESTNHHKISLSNESQRQTLRHSVSFNLSTDSFNETGERSAPRRRRTSIFSLSVGVGRIVEFGFVAAYHAREKVLRKCGQSEPLEFADIYSESTLRQCRKIGEGVYGEVFMNKTDVGRAVVLKIIPIEGSLEINGEPQKKFDEILSEITIALELSSLRKDKEFMTSSFAEVVQIRCVQGRYPNHLIDLWELYRDNYQTENDHPEIFTDDQIFIVLELANGGQDLEAFQFTNALQSKSAFQQTTLALAVAEKKFQFEHRDLHWGNILLAPTDDKFVNFKLNGEVLQVPSEGIKVTIIDYTLSRMLYEGVVLFNDLSYDEELFTANGDYQFDIYRLMKSNLDNDWKRFDPFNNVLWLHYIIDKLINGVRYKNPKSRKHRFAIEQMMVIRDELTNCKSAVESIDV